MFEGKARKLAEAIEERMKRQASGGLPVTAAVEVHARKPDSTAPGAGPVTFTWYEIRISDGARVAGLEVDEAGALLDDIDESWDADRLFAAIESLGVPVETAG